ncbi:MAG: hypothetical protein EZS28_038262 [Streblomastix strix]|uniref:Tc1-like transposase DDE domain-containing protein n=1 Tax=Streblomastix strix TaxID=222440 RepID=A0A5J4U8G7_9EUKA|nr:MAG: hypothetical protein EZS28_038262 [Streblomastix strix]
MINWNMMFAEDEKKFLHEEHNGYEFCLYAVDEEKVGDRYSVDFHRKRGVMVWIPISEEQIIHVETVEDKINSDSHCEMIGNDTITSIYMKQCDKFLLLQDNVSAHRANSTIQFLKEHNIERLQIPALKYDSNIIVNLWALIVRRPSTEEKAFNNEEQFWLTIKKIVSKMIKKRNE